MKKLISVFLSVIIALTSLFVLPESALAKVSVPNPPTSTGGKSVTYLQNDAREMLKMINNFRASSSAWYWNSDNKSKTTLKNLKPLSYDNNLEKIAMIRAAEIAVKFDHVRPDGTYVFNLMKNCGIEYLAAGENIAYGQKTNESVFTAWREDNDNYSGQGHRRNMLSSLFNAVGIGHAVVGGIDYWVQVFANIDNPQTNAKTTKTTAKASSTKKPSVTKGKITKVAKKSKGFSTTFTKRSGEVGYKLQYSTSKNFKSNTKTVNRTYKSTKAGSATLNVSGLKKNKTYYIRVCSYKTYKSNGKTKKVYGSWSAVKSVKTK